jgi:hypothetical protein
MKDTTFDCCALRAAAQLTRWAVSFNKKGITLTKFGLLFFVGFPSG